MKIDYCAQKGRPFFTSLYTHVGVIGQNIRHVPFPRFFSVMQFQGQKALGISIYELKAFLRDGN